MLRLLEKCEDRLLEDPVIAFCYLWGSMHEAPVIFQWSGPYFKTGNYGKFELWSGKKVATFFIKQNGSNSNEVSTMYCTTTPSGYGSFDSIDIRFRRKPARVKRTRENENTGDPTTP